ncbi:MAG: bifunctional phosphoglucose/phosphomannose isomerase [Microthrixaceae bacterium]
MIEPLDTLGMFQAAYRMPEQCLGAVERTDLMTVLPMAQGISSVLIVGMGSSGLAGNVVSAVAGPSCPVPILVSKNYECPEFVGPNTLVIAVSFSGATEETLEAVQQAAKVGARLIVLTAGGQLEQIAQEWGAPVISLDASIPTSRAAIGAVSIPPLLLLEQLGLFDGARAQVEAMISQMSQRRDVLFAEGNQAYKLAQRIGRTLPIVYGGGALGETAAWRWKGQFNENPKVASFAQSIPELTHNEICGWAQHGDVTRQVFSMVLLRHDFEHPQVQRRFELVAEICEEIVSGVYSVKAQGEGRLAQLFDLMLSGDLVSLHLAALEGIDPGPVPILDEIKARLR